MAPRVPAVRRGSLRLAAAAATTVLALGVGCGDPGDRPERSAGGSAATGTAPTTAPVTTAPPTTVPPTTTTTAPPRPVDAEAADPARVVVPGIGVDAPVIALGLGPDGALQPPAGVAETGWWREVTVPL